MAFCLVFCSTLAALVSVIPVLCSLNCVPNMVGVFGPPLTIWFGLRYIWRDPTLVLYLPSLITCIGTFRTPLLINQSPRAPCGAPDPGLSDRRNSLIHRGLRRDARCLLSGSSPRRAVLMDMPLPYRRVLCTGIPTMLRAIPMLRSSIADRESL